MEISLENVIDIFKLYSGESFDGTDLRRDALCRELCEDDGAALETGGRGSGRQQGGRKAGGGRRFLPAGAGGYGQLSQDAKHAGDQAIVRRQGGPGEEAEGREAEGL